MARMELDGSTLLIDNLRVNLRNTLGTGPDGLGISVKGFKGHEIEQVYIEIYEGKLRVYVWDGTQEDPVSEVVIEPET